MRTFVLFLCLLTNSRSLSGGLNRNIYDSWLELGTVMVVSTVHSCHVSLLICWNKGYLVFLSFVLKYQYRSNTNICLSERIHKGHQWLEF
jgi:hypothetical protein